MPKQRYAAAAIRRHCSRGKALGPATRTWTQTWSAPAERCSPILRMMAPSSPHAMIASEEPIAHMCQIIFGEPAAQQVIGVVRQRQIRPKPIGSDAARLVGAVTQDHGLLRQQQRALAQS
jgi:hypothetical protein